MIDSDSDGSNTARRNAFKNSILAQSTEFFFVLLPILVLGLISITKSSDESLWEATEWSFGAVVLFGQTIVKTVAAAGIQRVHPWERTGFVVASLLVFGLVPSLVVLAQILLLHHDAPGVLHDVPGVLQVLQLSLFAFGGMAFILFGSGSHYLMFRGK